MKSFQEHIFFFIWPTSYTWLSFMADIGGFVGLTHGKGNQKQTFLLAFKSRNELNPWKWLTALVFIFSQHHFHPPSLAIVFCKIYTPESWESYVWKNKRITLKMARSLSSRSGRFLRGNSRVVWILCVQIKYENSVKVTGCKIDTKLLENDSILIQCLSRLINWS